MKHTLYFKITNALVKVECTDESLDMVLDDMNHVDAQTITAAEFDETKVITHLTKGDCLLSFIKN